MAVFNFFSPPRMLMKDEISSHERNLSRSRKKKSYMNVDVMLFYVSPEHENFTTENAKAERTSKRDNLERRSNNFSSQ
jgi:hypothetical protein